MAAPRTACRCPADGSTIGATGPAIRQISNSKRSATQGGKRKRDFAGKVAIVTGMTPRPEHSAVCFNLIPTVGEYFVFPALTTTGPCEIMVFEDIPGGPMDCWGDVTLPEQHLEKSRWILDTFLPQEGARCRDVALTDDNGILAGRFPPTVRHPVGRLPSGRAVLGMGDVVVLNDPITGQGSNNASKCAKAYMDAILARGDRPKGQGEGGHLRRVRDSKLHLMRLVCTIWRGIRTNVGSIGNTAPIRPQRPAKAACCPSTIGAGGWVSLVRTMSKGWE